MRNENWHYGPGDFDPSYNEPVDDENPDEYEEYKYNYLKDEIIDED